MWLSHQKLKWWTQFFYTTVEFFFLYVKYQYLWRGNLRVISLISVLVSKFLGLIIEKLLLIQRFIWLECSHSIPWNRFYFGFCIRNFGSNNRKTGSESHHKNFNVFNIFIRLHSSPFQSNRFPWTGFSSSFYIGRIYEPSYTNCKILKFTRTSFCIWIIGSFNWKTVFESYQRFIWLECFHALPWNRFYFGFCNRNFG